jgi:putative ABC transport system permease protein
MLRTALTVSGIGIGILALVVVGSLAERLGTIVGRSTAINGNAIFAISTGLDRNGNAVDAISLDGAARTIRAFRGVSDVVQEVIVPYGITPGGGGGDPGRFGPPVFVFGFPPAARAYRTGAPQVVDGRDLAGNDSRAAVVGPDYAAAAAVKVGSTIAIYGNSFHVVGIIEKSFTLFDAAIVVPFADAQALLEQAVPPTIAALPRGGITAFMVVPKRGVDAGLVVARINTLDGVTARDPAEVANAVQSTIGIFDSIVFGAALIALLVGAFSIVNTMTIAVAERTREIGIRKAIGATDGDILREFLIEAAGIGTLGGLAGIALGALVVTYVDARSAAGGNLELFALSPRVALGAFGFAVVLSVVAGLVPAFGAARLAPTEALRRA